MTKEQIDKLVSDGIFPGDNGKRTLIETHISWVIVCGQFVYKIKKPVQYSFLDFSTLKLRKHFCERETKLNKRLTEGIYLDVQPIYEKEGNYFVGGKDGTVVEYAVRMQKLDKEKQMDQLLIKKQVTKPDITSLAETIANFHRHTEIIYKKDVLKIRKDFNDLEQQKEFLSEKLGDKYKKIIEHAIKLSDSFIEKSKVLLATRLREGFYRDCHGDLHSRNIFLLPAPVPFDCIEFNDDFRQIDVLNEVAFLCMDLDAFDRRDLSDQFITDYNRFFGAIRTSEEQRLFIYYKSYRANVRAKVNSLRAKSAANKQDENRALADAKKYLHLLDHYLKSFV
jgi:aminoglycoside phosphotransferase family enzyme